ncbi:hypothetical protein GQ457_16G005140 [Hibiscus cannabinus]
MIWKEIRPGKAKVPWKKLVWHSRHVPKTFTISWMATLDRLPIKSRLISFGLHIDGMCGIYGKELESRDHLFFECDFFRAIWVCILHLCGQHSQVMSWEQELAWAMRMLKGKSLWSAVMRLDWNGYITSIWKEHNRNFF